MTHINSFLPKLFLFTGMAAALSGNVLAGTTELISADSEGNPANFDAITPQISADGRYVVYSTFADNLLPNTYFGNEVYLHDRQTGTTERINVDPEGNETGGSSTWSDINPDGRYVAFASSATVLVADDTNGKYDVFVRDRSAGITERVSLSSEGSEANDSSFSPVLSADGRFVAFRSAASNLVPGDTGFWNDIFIHDRQTGTTERVSVDNAGIELKGHSDSPVISGDGRFVAFLSTANLEPGGSTLRKVYLHDRLNGTTQLVSVNDAGEEADNHSMEPSISANGRYVAFMSTADNLDGPNDLGTFEIYVRDLLDGSTVRVSKAPDGGAANGASFRPHISANGRYVAFDSRASNLVAGDTNGRTDIFLHDRLTGTTEMVSVTDEGEPSNGFNRSPAITPDVRYVAFESLAPNLTGHETFHWLIVVNDRGPVLPQDTLRAIVEKIWSLVPEDLNQGQADSLNTKLFAAIGSLDNGLLDDACGQLGAFQSQMSGFLEASQLDQGTGQEIIDYVTGVQVEVGCF